MKKFTLMLASLLLSAGSALADLVPEDRSGWIISGCSNETGEGAGLGTLDAMKDGNLSTFWHSVWSAATHQVSNHYFVVDRGETLAETALNAIGFTPRQDGTTGNGYVTACDIYMLDSVDGLNLWHDSSTAGVCDGDHNITDFVTNLTPTVQGTFTYHYKDDTNRDETIVNFPEGGVAGRYILFVVTAANGSQSENFANCAEFKAYVEVENVTYSDVTFNFPAFGEQTLSITLEQAIDGTDASSILPSIAFFEDATIDGDDTTISSENNTFTVTGNWTFPFADNQVYRMDLRKAASNNCTNLYYNVTTNKVETRNTTDSEVFVPERLFYLDANGFDSNGNLIVVLRNIVADETQGFLVSASNNATGTFSDSPTELLVVTNSTGTEGVTLQHPDNSNCHVNDISGTLGIWANGSSSQNDGGSYLRFLELSSDDFDGLLTGDYASYFTQDAVDTAKANPNSTNVRALFAPYAAYNAAATEANALIASVSGYTTENFGEGLGYFSGSSYEAIAALVATLQTALSGTDVDAIVAANNALSAELANVKVNLPEVDKYYRFKGYEGEWYITPTSASGQMAMSETATDMSAFYLVAVEGSENTFTVRSYYYEGVGITGTHSLGGDETYTFYASESAYPGAFTIKSNYSGSQYVYNHYDYTTPCVNRNSAYHTRCNWILEEIEKPSSTVGIEEILAEGAQVGIYDLQGRRLSAPAKGINIINGKKVLVK